MKNFSVRIVKIMFVFALVISLNVLPVSAQDSQSAQLSKDQVFVDPFANTQVVTKNASTGEITTSAIPQAKGITISEDSFSPAYIPNDNLMSPFSIIGTDNRTEMSTYIYGIAYVISNFPNGSTQGTAFFISDRALATAGHVVYDSELGGWANSITVSPSKNGSSIPFGTVAGTYFHTSGNFIANGDINYDYGVIEVADELGNDTGYFGYGYDSSPNGDSVTITGYPG
ncbi:MAG: trypsin-like serine protease, partial [Gorillibacterium sp.]|nr:trypsin-like serine protease [Gorillibacterium sp.]